MLLVDLYKTISSCAILAVSVGIALQVLVGCLIGNAEVRQQYHRYRKVKEHKCFVINFVVGGGGGGADERGG